MSDILELKSPSGFVRKLVLAGMAVCLAVGLLVGTWLWQSYRLFEAQALTNAENLSQLLERGVAAHLDRVDAALLTISDEIRRQKSLGQGDEAAALHSVMQRQLLRLPGVETLRLLNAANGVRQRVSAPLAHPVGLSDQEVLTYVREDVSPGLVSAMSVQSHVSGRWGILLVRQITTPDGQYDGMIAAVLTLDHLVKLFGGLELGEKGAVSLRDQRLTVLARYPETLLNATLAAGKSAPSNTLLTLIDRQPLTGSYVAEAGLDKITRALSYRKISGYPFYVIVGLASDHYLRGWWEQVAKASLMAAALLGMILVMGVLVWRSWSGQERAMGQVQQANDRLQAVLQNIPAGLVIVDQDRHIQMVNQRLSEILAVDCPALLHHSTRGLFGSQEQFEELGQKFQQAFARGDLYHEDVLLQRVDGRAIWVRLSGRRLLQPGGQWEVVWICEDISYRKEQEQRLQQQEARMRLLVEAATDWIWEVDHQGHYTYSSPRVQDILGMKPEQVIGCSVFGFLDREQAAMLEARFTEARSGNIPAGFVHSLRRTRQGETCIMESAISPIIDAQGVFQGFRGIDRDMTARHHMEQALQEKTEELSRSNAELEAFAYVASHDLREPLRMVSSYVALLERRYADRLDGDALEYIAFAKDGAQRLDRLILDLLEYSRVGRVCPPATMVPLAEAVQDALFYLDAALKESGGQVEIPDTLPVLRAHRPELVRLLQNLFGNALKYRDPHRPPRIRLVICAQDGFWLCSVEDNGIGIEPQDAERVFGIFQRLHPRDRYEGTGIGLALCRKIVEHHHGRIWVESVPGQGSAFRWTMPKD